jgi:hypothetical protein
MESRHITAIVIVAIVMIAMVLRSAFVGHRRRHLREREEPRDDGETLRLREEVKNLKERLAVIERITVEKENSLAREIEQLRDEPRR